jgi:hypothetical protein
MEHANYGELASVPHPEPRTWNMEKKPKKTAEKKQRPMRSWIVFSRRGSWNHSKLTAAAMSETCTVGVVWGMRVWHYTATTASPAQVTHLYTCSTDLYECKAFEGDAALLLKGPPRQDPELLHEGRRPLCTMPRCPRRVDGLLFTTRFLLKSLRGERYVQQLRLALGFTLGVWCNGVALQLS